MDFNMTPLGTEPSRRPKPSRRAERADRAERPGRTQRPSRTERPSRAETWPEAWPQTRTEPRPKTRPRTRPNPHDPRTRPPRAPRHTRPAKPPRARPSFKLRAKAADWAAAAARPRPRHPRAPFLLLLVGLLGGALVSLLMISTTLAQGSYRISNLQQQNTNLARQEQLLSQQVAQAESPTQIAQEAEQFGMQQNPNLRFINLKTGKIVAGKVTTADSQINVPGYTP